MRVVIESVSDYKKLIKEITGVPSYKKLMNSVEQCVEIVATAEEDNNFLELYMVESGSHAVKIIYNDMITVQEDGSLLITIDKLKNLTSRLKNNKVVTLAEYRNLFNYVQPPLGGIADTLFCYEHGLRKDMLNSDDYSLVIEDLSFFAELIPTVVSYCYNDKSIVLQTSPTEIVMICTFAENGYIKYTMPSISMQTSKLTLNVKPKLLKIVPVLDEGIQLLQHSKDKNMYMFDSNYGAVAMKTDPDIPGIVKAIEAILKYPSTCEFVVNHAEVKDGADLQSYGGEPQINLWIEKDTGVLKYNTDRNNTPAGTQIISQNAKDLILQPLSLPLDQFTNGLKALGASKGILTITNLFIQVKEIKIGQNNVRVVIMKADDDPETKAEVLIYEVPKNGI